VASITRAFARIGWIYPLIADDDLSDPAQTLGGAPS
jgi:hypothetical protein